MSSSPENAHIRIMRTVNPEPGKPAWAVTKVRELSRDGKIAFGKLEFLQEGIRTRIEANNAKMRYMMKEGVFSW